MTTHNNYSQYRNYHYILPQINTTLSKLAINLVYISCLLFCLSCSFGGFHLLCHCYFVCSVIFESIFSLSVVYPFVSYSPPSF